MAGYGLTLGIHRFRICMYLYHLWQFLRNFYLTVGLFGLNWGLARQHIFSSLLLPPKKKQP